MSSVDYKKATSIYDFTVKDSFDNDVKLDKYKGNVVIVVNIASQCGLTKSNYAKLTELKNRYNDSGNYFHSIHFSIIIGLMPIFRVANSVISL